MDDFKDRLEIQPSEKPEGSPSWCTQVEYINHTKQDISGYNDYLTERPEEQYFFLLEYFVLAEDDLLYLL